MVRGTETALEGARAKYRQKLRLREVCWAEAVTGQRPGDGELSRADGVKQYHGQTPSESPGHCVWQDTSAQRLLLPRQPRPIRTLHLLVTPGASHCFCHVLALPTALTFRW